MTEPATSPVGSVDKALQLIELLADAGPEGLTLREIAAATGIHKPTAHRTLQALAHRGFAEQHDDQRYRLGARPALLVERFQRGENLPTLFRPALLRISQQTQELVHLGTLESQRVLYLDKVEPERTIRVWSRIGRHAPVATTALGRAMAAADGAPAALLDAYAAGDESTLPRFREAVADARRLGYSSEREENEPGICCVGVALVRPTGRPVAVSITGPTARIDPERQHELGMLLRTELARAAPAGFTLAAPAG